MIRKPGGQVKKQSAGSKKQERVKKKQVPRWRSDGLCVRCTVWLGRARSSSQRPEAGQVVHAAAIEQTQSVRTEGLSGTLRAGHSQKLWPGRGTHMSKAGARRKTFS